MAREAILSVVEAFPGVHLREVQRRTSFGWGKLHHHVLLLLRASAIGSRRVGPYVKLYPRRGTPTGREAGALGKTALRLKRAIDEEGGSTQADLRRATGLSTNLISYHLLRMEAEGIVEARGRRPKRYHAAANLNSR